MQSTFVEQLACPLTLLPLNRYPPTRSELIGIAFNGILKGTRRR